MVGAAPKPDLIRKPKEGERTMGLVVKCDCGTDVRGTTDDELVENAQEHAKNKHALTVTREQALALAERE
jgi:predicted small metal-binding protein